MKCKKCGKEIYDYQEYCVSCESLFTDSFLKECKKNEEVKKLLYILTESEDWESVLNEITLSSKTVILTSFYDNHSSEDLSLSLDGEYTYSVSSDYEADNITTKNISEISEILSNYHNQEKKYFEKNLVKLKEIMINFIF